MGRVARRLRLLDLCWSGQTVDAAIERAGASVFAEKARRTLTM